MGSVNPSEAAITPASSLGMGEERMWESLAREIEVATERGRCDVLGGAEVPGAGFGCGCTSKDAA